MRTVWVLGQVERRRRHDAWLQLQLPPPDPDPAVPWWQGLCLLDVVVSTPYGLMPLQARHTDVLGWEPQDVLHLVRPPRVRP